MKEMQSSIQSMGYDFLGLSSVVYSIGISEPAETCGPDGCDGGCNAGCKMCMNGCMNCFAKGPSTAPKTL